MISGRIIGLFSILIVLSVYNASVNAKSQLKDLNETTWMEMLNGEWFIQFYAPWCPACKQLAPIWKEFSDWSADLGIQVGQVDVTTNPGLSGRFMITALPTVYHVKDGIFRLYTGARDKDALFSFIEDKKWTKIEPVSAWGSPQSISMSTVAYFFQLSMTLRDMHNYLTGEMGLHSWTAHAVFGLATILTGVLLGLLVVAIIDFMYSIRRWMSNGNNIKDIDDSRDGIGENNDIQPLIGEAMDDEAMDDENIDDAELSDTNRFNDSTDSIGNLDLEMDKCTIRDSSSPTKVIHRKVLACNFDPNKSNDEP